MYYFKESIFLFFYSLILSFMSLAAINTEIVWLKYVLIVISLLFHFFITALECFNEGQKAYKQLYSNDMLRKRIIETGEDIKIDNRSEYKPFKGFLISFFVFLPMIVFLLVHLIIVVSGGQTYIMGTIANFLYLFISAPIYLIYNSALPAFAFFIVLYGVVLSVCIGGFAYLLGARKIELQYEKIEEKHKSIYGE